MMKIINIPEFKKLTPLEGGKAKKSEFRDMLKELKVGQKLFVPKEEWFGYGYSKATTPAVSASSVSIESKRTIRFKTQLFNEGWVIERTE